MGTEGFISVNFWTALFTLLNFLLVLFVGKKFLYAPVMKMIQSRQQEIDNLYADAGHAKEEAQKPEGGVYGLSITDACIGWEKTEQLVCDLADLR